MAKLHIKKGDMVYVNAGNDKGKTGKVLAVDTENNRAIVEGVNMVSKHTKPNSKNPQGGIVKKEAGVHVSNLQVVDPVAWAKRANSYATRKNQVRRSSNGKERKSSSSTAGSHHGPDRLRPFPSEEV